MAAAAPPLPAPFKPIQHYLKIAAEHDRRDPVVAYYCRFYSVQTAMGIDKKSPDCRSYIVYLMDQLETTKKQYADDEAIANDVVGQAHLENYALKLFVYADNEDRASRFGKNVVKSFYSAGMLMDVLTTFGELSVEIEKNRKYAKWKAAYIHNCLKSGETPMPGPMPEEDDEFSESYDDQPSTSSQQPPPPSVNYNPGPTHPNTLPSPNIPQQPYAPPSTPQDPYSAGTVPTAHQPHAQYQPPANTDQVHLEAKDYQRAMKLCKFASSALQYEDKATAIDNLTKALNLLNTGNE